MLPFFAGHAFGHIQYLLPHSRWFLPFVYSSLFEKTTNEKAHKGKTWRFISYASDPDES